MIIQEIKPSESGDWEKMRRDLWPDGADDHAAEIASFFAGTLPEPHAVLVAYNDGSVIAVAELSIRDDVPGFCGKRVGYVEGLYVKLEWRGRGVAHPLLRAAKLWARQNICEMFASDRADRLIIDKRFWANQLMG
jgi:aminoglycoside 6'-N-acetyltransferase I